VRLACTGAGHDQDVAARGDSALLRRCQIRFRFHADLCFSHGWLAGDYHGADG
jgi:hypothetical protein